MQFTPVVNNLKSAKDMFLQALPGAAQLSLLAGFSPLLFYLKNLNC